MFYSLISKSFQFGLPYKLTHINLFQFLPTVCFILTSNPFYKCDKTLFRFWLKSSGYVSAVWFRNAVNDRLDV